MFETTGRKQGRVHSSETMHRFVVTSDPVFPKWRETVDHTVDIYVAQVGDHTVVIYAQAPDEDRAKATPAFDQILDSIKTNNTAD